MMSVIVFVTLNHNSMVSPLLGAILTLTDFIFTSLGLLSPLLLSAYTARYHHDDVCILVSRKNALVVGTDDHAVKYALDLDRTGDFNVVGLVSTDSQNDGLVINDYHVYYSHDLNEIDILGWRLGGVDCVFIPPKSGQGLLSGKGQKNVIHDDGMSSLGKAIKRGADFFLSALLIIIFSPLAVVCALAVKMEDGGPVFYRQQRVGLNGKLFNILKFRSMHVDAEHDGARFCSGCDDPRLTRVGTFLRAHHLDELPQLLNVFVGDMSFVGYRPERPCFIARIIEENPRYDFLYQIRPGVTSYATLYNGYTDTFEKMLTRLDLDLYYLRHHSIGFDMKVLFLTFISIVSGKKF